MIQSMAKCHKPEEARECAGEMAGLLPATATGDELRRAMASPEVRNRIAVALEEIFESVQEPPERVQASFL